MFLSIDILVLILIFFLAYYTRSLKDSMFSDLFFFLRVSSRSMFEAPRAYFLTSNALAAYFNIPSISSSIYSSSDKLFVRSSALIVSCMSYEDSGLYSAPSFSFFRYSASLIFSCKFFCL